MTLASSDAEEQNKRQDARARSLKNFFCKRCNMPKKKEKKGRVLLSWLAGPTQFQAAG
eukprot:CAMPEP_0206589538 /NCGR_PEP_ID=MMETSP0325_2-20121206/38989_1 /ASSEMBLY_ACC=CAM_ASM_000347 /TAXON_ID=2866 /ORGANISM="Crypthecodinium cohnii, Strain Seligo" /LENGTH=57 /DNA_ID=CAMNT_0054098129 /DNA_START=315 /DNA_END=488 /DNA_ORIENTATION=+